MSLIRYYTNSYPGSLDRFLTETVESMLGDLGSRSSHYTSVKSYSGDVKSDSNSTNITIEMPGVSVDGLEVTVSDHTLKVSGKSRTEKEYKYSYILNPSKHDEENITANLKDGILEVKVPHATQVQPRTIEVMTS